MVERKSSAAWGEAGPRESRWPASLTVVLAAALNFALAEKLSFGPEWLFPALEMAILVPLQIVAPNRIGREQRTVQYAAVALIALVNIANVASLVLLVETLIFDAKAVTGPSLLLSAAAIWVTNILVFALWYWEIDRGGPDDRLRADHRAPDFLFPQMVTPDCTHEAWSPRFVDYLYLAYTNATAFSPTDTMPLTPIAKMLMLVQATASLVTIAVVASRAINILS
ncbi:MAG: hypothetical protein ACREM2_00790 [Vulcanimicrobiaceae bacterium]